MTTVILILALAAAFAGLVRYVRNDRFAGPNMPNGGHPGGVTAARDVLR